MKPYSAYTLDYRAYHPKQYQIAAF
jgi:hypothetical protein